MKVWTSTEKIWWYLDSDDKPSIEYFEQFDKRLESNDNIKVNFMNYDNVAVVNNTDDLTYIKVEHNNKIYYYYVTGITRITNGGYELSLVLDFYSTYTLPFLKELKNNNTLVKVVRTTYKDDGRLFLIDDMLDALPKTYDKVVYEKKERLTTNGYYYTRGEQSGLTYGRLQIEKTNKVFTPVIYALFKNSVIIKNPEVRSDILVPIFSLSGQTKIKTSSNGTSWTDYTVNNDFYNIQYSFAQHGDKDVGTFDGFYILPNAMDLVNANDVGFGVKEFVFGVSSLKLNAFYIESPILNRTLDSIKLPILDKVELSANSPYLTDISFLRYMNIKYFDNELDWGLIGYEGTTDINLNIPSPLFSYADSAYFVFNNNKLPLSNTIINLPYQLPSISDTYHNYVIGTMNTVNTSYQIAKQQAIKQQITAGLTFGLSTIGNVIKQDYGNIAGNTLSFANNIVGAQMSLKNKERMIRAQYADAKLTMLNKINSSNVNDNKWLKYILDTSGIYDGLEISYLSANTLSQMNNILYYYGYFNPSLNNINVFYNAKRGNDFRYIAFETDWTKLLIGKSSLNIPKNLYDAVITDLCGGVRLWDKIPNY